MCVCKILELYSVQEANKLGHQRNKVICGSGDTTHSVIVAAVQKVPLSDLSASSFKLTDPLNELCVDSKHLHQCFAGSCACFRSFPPHLILINVVIIKFYACRQRARSLASLICIGSSAFYTFSILHNAFVRKI